MHETWLEPFSKMIDRPWDITNIHINKNNMAGVKASIDYYYNKYKKPLWVSEFACVLRLASCLPCPSEDNPADDLAPYHPSAASTTRPTSSPAPTKAKSTSSSWTSSTSSSRTTALPPMPTRTATASARSGASTFLLDHLVGPNRVADPPLAVRNQADVARRHDQLWQDLPQGPPAVPLDAGPAAPSPDRSLTSRGSHQQSLQQHLSLRFFSPSTSFMFFRSAPQSRGTLPPSTLKPHSLPSQDAREGLTC
jgi:hypothetical protein